jgi:serine/threonine protein kinase
MNQLLRPNQTVRSQTSQTLCTVDHLIGGGGQGEVYAARLGDPAKGHSQTPVALKWFYPHYLGQDRQLEQRLTDAIAAGPPSDRFLWPQELVRSGEVAGFGYLMPLREKRFSGIVDLVMRRVNPSFRSLVTAGFELAQSYFLLHAKGLCYRDISFGNVFFDPKTGEVRICDNDNVGIDRKAGGGIGGTARFMAPEIVRGEAAPSSQTDLFSLAVLLFYMLMNHHPLEGTREADIRCFDLPAMTRLYGDEPIFIFDPTDERNRPLPGHHDNALALWPLYPAFLRELFTRSFTAGIRDASHGGRARQRRIAQPLLVVQPHPPTAAPDAPEPGDRSAQPRHPTLPPPPGRTGTVQFPLPGGEGRPASPQPADLGVAEFDRRKVGEPGAGWHDFRCAGRTDCHSRFWNPHPLRPPGRRNPLLAYAPPAPPTTDQPAAPVRARIDR